MITTLYAGILGIVYILLTAHVIQGRYRYRIGLGDGGNDDLSRRVRIHANFAEYVPFALLLLFLVGEMHTSGVIVHALGMMLVLGRGLHAWGLSRSPVASPGRMIGMILTLAMIIVSSLILLWKFLVLQFSGL